MPTAAFPPTASMAMVLRSFFGRARLAPPNAISVRKTRQDRKRVMSFPLTMDRVAERRGDQREVIAVLRIADVDAHRHDVEERLLAGGEGAPLAEIIADREAQ